MKKYLYILIGLAIVLAGLGMNLGNSSAQTNTVNLKGWAWSSTMGWLSFNSANSGAGSGSSYSVKIATTTVGSNIIGDFSGHAWSPYMGWVSFNRSETGNPPSDDIGGGSGPIAQVNMTTGAVTGWARALVGKSADVSGNQNQTSEKWFVLGLSGYGTDPGNLLAPGLSDLYLSSDGGVSYTKINSLSGKNSGYGAISDDGQKIYAIVYNTGSLDDLMYSSDGGTTWTKKNLPGSYGYVKRYVKMSQDGKNVYVITRANNDFGDINHYLYVSNDYGATWTRNLSFGAKRMWSNSSLSLSADGKNLIYVESFPNNPGYIYRSTDYGNTWSRLTSSLISGSAYWTESSMSYDGSVVYALKGNDFTNLYMSADSGNNWTTVSLPTGLATAYNNSRKSQYVRTSADGSTVIYGYIYTYNNTGEVRMQNFIRINGSWSQMSTNYPVYGFTNYMNTPRLVGYNGYSENNGASWTNVSPVSTRIPAFSNNQTVSNQAIVGDSSWDGWIKLSGTDHPTQTSLTGTATSTRGVSFNKESGIFSGFAWGDVNVGWLQFRGDGPNGGGNVECEIPGVCGTSNSWSLSCEAPTGLVYDGGSVTGTFTADLSGSNQPSNPTYTWTGGGGTTVGGTNSSTLTKQYTSAGTYGGPSLTVSGKTVQCSNVTVSNGTTPPPPGGNCTTPLNAEICTAPEGTTDNTKILKDSCPANVTTNCTFECSDGFKLYFGECVKIDITED